MTGQVDIWKMRLDLSDELIAQYKNSLDDYEKKRADKFVMLKDKTRYIAAHGQMRQILSSYLDVMPSALQIKQGKNKKPRLIDHMLHFNLSHSGQYALLAVSSTGEVGIDIECMAENFSLTSAGKSAFSVAEYQSICKMDVLKQKEAFYKCWTSKEAFIKAIGLGFSFDTKSFTVSTESNKPPGFLFFDKNEYRADQWKLVSFQPFANTEAALALSFELTLLQHFEFNPWANLNNEKSNHYAAFKS